MLIELWSRQFEVVITFERKVILNSTTKAWIVAAIGVVFLLAIVWQVRASHRAAINLTADDMTQIASDQSPQSRARLATDDGARRDFAKNVRELLW